MKIPSFVRQLTLIAAAFLCLSASCAKLKPAVSSFSIDSGQTWLFEPGQTRAIPYAGEALQDIRFILPFGWDAVAGEETLNVTAPVRGNIVAKADTIVVIAAGSDGKTFEAQLPLRVDWEYDVSDGALRVLAIGNSFSEDAVEQYLYEIADAAGVKLLIGNLYIGGCSLSAHLGNIRKNGRAYDYRKVVDGKKTSRSGVQMSRAFLDEPWDIVTLQQVSGLSGQYESYADLAPLMEEVRRQLPDARFLWHQTWAYETGSSHSDFSRYDRDQLKMYQCIMDASSRAMAEHPGLSGIIPSGTAVQNARGTVLGDTFTRDGYHLENTYGRYTAACTWFEALTGRDVSEAPMWHPATIGTDTARLCRLAAHAAQVSPYSTTPMLP